MNMFSKINKKNAKAVKSPRSRREKYYEDGKTWENETITSLRSSKNRAWFMTMLSMFFSLLCIGALLMLLPLKTFEPYVVTVDKSTGYLEVTRGLKDGDLTQDEAVTQSNLVRYLVARETYDYQDLEENFNLVTSMSDGDAALVYGKIWNPTNGDKTPSEKYGYDTTKTVKIKSINFLNDYTAQIRFQKLTHTKATDTTKDYVAIITFKYVQKPESMVERFMNPLGFKVIKYRVDQEIL